jgi:hypothetical protein
MLRESSESPSSLPAMTQEACTPLSRHPLPISRQLFPSHVLSRFVAAVAAQSSVADVLSMLLSELALPVTMIKYWLARSSERLGRNMVDKSGPASVGDIDWRNREELPRCDL